MYRNLFRSLLLVAACVLVVGCSGNKGEVSVSGHLTRGGKPCEGVAVNFVPDDMMSQAYIGGTRADGGFDMVSMKGTKGVLPGVYSVQIAIPLDAPGGALVNQKMQGRESVWRVTVTDKGFTDLQLDMDKEKLE